MHICSLPQANSASSSHVRSCHNMKQHKLMIWIKCIRNSKCMLINHTLAQKMQFKLSKWIILYNFWRLNVEWFTVSISHFTGTKNDSFLHEKYDKCIYVDFTLAFLRADSINNCELLKQTIPKCVRRFIKIKCCSNSKRFS
jgi:hypothetical protein